MNANRCGLSAADSKEPGKRDDVKANLVRFLSQLFEPLVSNVEISSHCRLIDRMYEKQFRKLPSLTVGLLTL
jgi:hypothetical protein